MAKLNRGNSHISIGQYMVQAGWPMVGVVRSIFLGYNDLLIQPLDLQSDFFNMNLNDYDTDSHYNPNDNKDHSHVRYANKNTFYKLMYRLVGHGYDSNFDEVYPVLSTLDNPELLRSSSYQEQSNVLYDSGEGHHLIFKQYDATAMERDEYPEGGAMVKRKLTQGWQQFRGSFEPMRKSLKGLTKIFSRYKSRNEVVHNDALSFVYGIGNVIEGVTQIVLVPFFLLFRLLKHVGLLIRHPFTGASYSNLVVRFARDIGYSATWVIEGSLETVQGVIRIAMQLPKWLIQMPLRGIRTAFTGTKTYATFVENAGTQALINTTNQEINVLVAKCVGREQEHMGLNDDNAKQQYLKNTESQIVLPKGVLSMINGVQYKGLRARKKGQKVDLNKFFKPGNPPKVTEARLFIQNFNPEAEKFTL